MSEQELLTTADFDFPLPESLIAHVPAERRTESKLLVYRPGNPIEDHFFHSLGQHIPNNAVFVRNATKVFCSRLRGKKETGASIEIFLLSSPEIDGEKTCRVQCLAKPMKKLPAGTIIHFEFGQASVVQKREGQTPTLDIQFLLPKAELLKQLASYGSVPLPPYISRSGANSSLESLDKDRYQTVYAKEELQGSVAAPTAGLHFTKELEHYLITEKGSKFLDIDLQVGGGTFLPVKVDTLSNHEMHTEKYCVSEGVWNEMIEAKEQKRPIIVIGTTSLRSIEAFSRKAKEQSKDQLYDRYHETDLFIYPPDIHYKYKSKIADALITNFHQPRSTLFMLISSLIGYPNAKAVYSHAINSEYRFFSYGDSSLLWL